LGQEGETEVALYYIDFNDPDEDIKNIFMITIKEED